MLSSVYIWRKKNRERVTMSQILTGEWDLESCYMQFIPGRRSRRWVVKTGDEV